MTSKKMHNILFVTGTRADYGKLEPLAHAAKKRGHQVTFFVTGMHMLARYGLTKNEVHRDNQFKVVEYLNQRDNDAQDIIMAKTIIGFSDYLQEMHPDLVVIHGDRIEALACSLVCAINYIRCAHVEGGEVSGTIDEVFRHCNTKLSTCHLVSSEDARHRVLQLGEAKNSVYVIGSPELDIHLRPSGIKLEDIKHRYEIHTSDYGICIFHPVTSEMDSIGAQAKALFSTLEQSGKYFVVILPNNDPGSRDIENVIKTLPSERFRVLPSMRFIYFSELMKNTKVIVGNSSVGVREAPFLGVPSLDIGSRQFNRSQAEFISQCAAFDKAAIEEFLLSRWGKRFHPHQGFGTGSSTERFVALLDQDDFWTHPLQKHFSKNIQDA